MRCFIGLGSNVGNRRENLLAAWRMLSPHCGSMTLSSVYESRPLYVLEQPAYLNAVGSVQTELEPHALLEALHEVERKLGRDRSREKRMGPRTLDLDILLYGELVTETPDLVVPHPRLLERAFVLVPLLELDPGLLDPRTGTPFALALAALDNAGGGPESRGVYLSDAQ